jgi:hypothetical protein
LHRPDEFSFQRLRTQIVVLDYPRPQGVNSHRGEVSLKPVRQLWIPDHQVVEGVGGEIVHPALNPLLTDGRSKGQHQECRTRLGEFPRQGGNQGSRAAGLGGSPRLGKGQQAQGGVAHKEYRMVGMPEPAQISPDHEGENDRQQGTEQREEREEEPFHGAVERPLAITAGASVRCDRREAPGPFLDPMTESLPSLNEKIGHVILSGGIGAQDHENGWRRREWVK